MGALLGPVGLTFGLVALGANSALLGTLFSLISFTLAAICCVVLAPRWPVWFEIRAVLALFLAALAWPLLPFALAPLLPAAADWLPSVAPGLFMSRWLEQGAAFGWLVIGVLTGFRFRFTRISINVMLVLIVLWLVVASILHQSGFDYPAVWGVAPANTDRFAVTLLNPNAAGCVLAMFAIVAASLCLSSFAHAAGFERFGWMMPAASGVAALFAVVILIAGITLTDSRLALALALVGVLVVAVGRFGKLVELGVEIAIPAAGLLVLPPIFALLFVDHSLTDKFRALPDDFELRIHDLQSFIAMSLERPWFGIGLGGFRDLNAATLTPDTALHRWNFGAAHNILVQTAIESGWPCAVLTAMGVVALVIKVQQSRRFMRFDGQTAGVAVAAFAGLIGGLVDIALDVPAVMAIEAWFGGILLGRATRAVLRGA